MRSVKRNKVLVSLDVEGPQVQNDNAFELAEQLANACFLEQGVGREFFKRISKIDDIWGDFRLVPQDPSYSSGHTLKVILPFFKAMGATEKELYRLSRENLRIVPGIKEVLAALQKKYEVWMISTSYEWFIRAYCDYVGFPFDHVYCTKVENFDQIPITEDESKCLLDYMQKFALLTPVIEYDKQTGKVIPDHQPHYDALTQLIWEKVYKMPVGELLRTVHPVGQMQKKETAREIARKRRFPRKKIMYVGDSQTDVQVVKWLLETGLTMMFNGKGRVCSFSDIMYIGENAQAILEVADLFAGEGRQAVIEYYKPPREAKCGGLLAAVTPENVEALEAQSVKKRKEFRGVHIGELT